MVYVSLTCRVALALVFLVSATGKLRGRAAFRAFRASLRELGVLPASWAMPLAVGTAAAEVAIVLLLLPAPAALAGFAVAGLLLIAFSATIVASLRRGVRARCRCFGRASRPLGRAHVARNLLLLALAAAGAGATLSPATTAGAPHPAGTAVAAAAGLVLGVLAVVFDDLVDLFAAAPATSAAPPHRPQ